MASPTPDSVNSDAITLPKELRSGDDAQRVESATLTRESGAHEAFARSRMDGFVYVETPPYMHVLDGHCRFEFEIGTSPLMVVLGHPASGKSALLVNWVHQRLKKQQPGPEVIFQHYCGCSYESVKLSVFLFRLMDHLKAAFSLRDFELPHEHEEEKLKFSLARCLDAANRTTTQNGKRKKYAPEITYKELTSKQPLMVGVRILVSATRPPKTTQLASCRWIVRKDFTYDAEYVCDNVSLDLERNQNNKPDLHDFGGSDDLLYDASLPPNAADTHCNTPRDLASVHCILDSKGSSCPLYLRLVLTMLDQSSHHPQPEYLQSLLLHASDFPSLYEVRCYRPLTCRHAVMSVFQMVLQQWKAILLADLVDTLDHLTCKAAASVDLPPQLDRPDSRKRNSRRDSEHMTLVASQLSPEEDEINRTKMQMERRALLARHALSLFTVSRFGLSEKDFHHLLEDAAPRHIRTLLLQLLMPHLMVIYRKDSDAVLYDISHNQLRLLARYGFLKDDGLRHGYHKAIASYCEKMPTCQRRIDELPVQLECCGLWSQLQSCLVDIKMFQLWWHERNRQDFLAYWKTLRSYFSTHDPVDDYIRSLDEYIEVEGPSTEQLLSLFLTITEFLRSWQRNDVKVKPEIHMHRPDPPQLKEFINSQGNFSLSHLTDVESKQIQGIVDYLCPHHDDGYYVRRWLWTQFPLIAVSFENLFLKKFTSDALAAWSGVGEMDGGGDCPVSLPSSDKPKDKPTGASPSNSCSTHKSSHTILPKSIGAAICESRKRILARHSPKKNSQAVLELLNPEVSGAFEFGDSGSEISLSIPALRDQLRDLRARYDKLKFISKERHDALHVLESKVNDAKANTSHQHQNSRLRDELLEQIRVTTLDSTHGRQKSDYYKSILRQCETNPARDPNIIESSEMNVRKMKQDITDLQQKAQVIGYERRLAAIEIPKLTTAIQEKLQIHQVALSRDALILEFQNLKLGQTTVKAGKTPASSLTGTSRSVGLLPTASIDGNGIHHSSSGNFKGHNLKQVEQRLAEATAVSQQKKQRALRLKGLSENLHLGLLHLAVMLGVKASQGMDSIMLANAAEHSVRGLIGEDGGSGAPSNLALRKKNSMRKGITQTQAPVQRSAEDIQRYNLRVRTSVSPKKRFAGVECHGDENGDDSFSDSDDSDASGHGEEAVRERADIKASSVTEVRTQTGGKRPAKRHGKKKPTSSPSGATTVMAAMATNAAD
ncbi:hypothetical protein B5M09_002686 [Aphanomyces astaci]|uniref:NACHT domain-containing protein n=1 Tax=Aphanomyces astaci TaxID=112090 RepID=A0A3R7WLW9_APHAT|nr:hypothetical protein B5M09_002686 [Aphanomyces astaci]